MPSARPTGEDALVAAWVPVSLVDFPGRIAAVIFLEGCNFRCPFCHNPHLVLPERRLHEPLSWIAVLRALEARRGFLDGVVLSGGEPLLSDAVPTMLADLRRLDLHTKLDTNGSLPDALETLLDRDLLDYVAVDVKAPWTRYGELAGVAVDAAHIRRSVDLVCRRAPKYELRTTAAPGLEPEDLLAIAEQIAGARRYVLQPFIDRGGEGLLDPAWAARRALSADELGDVWKQIAANFADGGVRGV
jgi:pyruvate formate lyase activating enzyme